MKLIWNDDHTVASMYVRQSWLKDATMCPEKGRRAIISPDWNTPNELTAFGTAVHAAAEAKLLGSATNRAQMLDAALEAFRELDTDTLRWVKYQRHELLPLFDLAVDAWLTDVYPSVDGDILGVEHNFTYEIGRFEHNGVTVILYGTGTIDLVTSTQLWDWKTSTRRYKPAEKQKQDIQSTMYGGAAVAAGWAEWPLTFNFGVMIRGKNEGQIVPVDRDASHFEWLRRTSMAFARQYLNNTTDVEWPMNDTHYLCSDTWCPFWSVCRGCHAQ